MWSGELSDNYTAAFYVHCNTEKETVDVNVRLNQHITPQPFPKHCQA